MEHDVRRLFLQAVLSRGVLSSKLAQTLWLKSVEAVKAANPRAEKPEEWTAFVADVNKSIDNLDLEFRHLIDETSGKEMYALVNRKGDEIAQMATEYSSVEIAYFKAIVEQIMLAPNESYSVSSLAALREVNALNTNMTKTQAEVVLSSFVAKGWLLKSQRGRYSLSTRTLIELLPYLRSTYQEEVIECTICFEVLTRGIACGTNNCKARLHWHCFATYRRHHSNCPACAKPWPSEARPPLLSVGEDAVKDGSDDRRRVRRKVEESEEEEEESEPEGMEVDELSEDTQTQSQTQNQKQPARQRSQRGRRG